VPKQRSSFTVGAFGALALAMLVLAIAAPLALARDAYVGNEGSGTVSVIDLASGDAVGSPIGVGAGAGAMAITPDGRKAYVANTLDDSVSVIDTQTNSVIGEPIEVGIDPRGIAVTPDGSRVYVCNEEPFPFEGAGSVSMIDTATDAVVGEPIPVGRLPRGVAISPDGTAVYIGNRLDKSVSVIDAASEEVVGEPIEVGENPQGIAFTPNGAKAYVANLDSGDVSVINTATKTVTATIPVGSLPVGVAISPDGSRVYVSNTGSDTVSVIDTASDLVVGEPIDVDAGPRGIAVGPGGVNAYVATGFFSSSPGTVTSIDIASADVVGEPIEVGEKPLGIAIVPDQPPHAALASRDGIALQAIRFDASASTDPDGQVARYDWNFGDGQRALDAGPTPTHTYSATGEYKVTVTVTDSEGCSTGFVFTGLTASCNGSPLAAAASAVNVGHYDPGARFSRLRIGKLHRNKSQGTAKLEVTVPGPGTLKLAGRKVRTVERAVGAAGKVNLVVRPKVSAMEALKRGGHLKVLVKIAFRPDEGMTRPLSKTIRLIYRPSGPMATAQDGRRRG
jgi:YVTN family beta-propeller protein